jgi:4-azaleucine resistance transporter AzlC
MLFAEQGVIVSASDMRASKTSWQLWRQGIGCAQPIMIGYFPVAVMFGISTRSAGLSAWEALAMSLLIFAGASQFALIGMLASGMPLTGALVATAGLNLRHLFYGPALVPLLRLAGWRQALPIAFGLTDEVFAAALSLLPQHRVDQRPALLFGLETGAYGSWVFGTLVGALGFQAAARLVPALLPVLSFSLPSLFLVILLPLARGRGAASALVAILVTTALVLAGFSTAALLAGGISGALVGALYGVNRD